MPFFDIFASPRWSPLRMRTKVASFFIFFQELSNKKKIKALRPKMTKIASRGGPALRFVLYYAIANCKTKWDVFTIRFYSRGIPFPGCHCGANRPSLSLAVHSFRSCRGRRASFLGRKSSNKSISNLMEALATQPEGWTCSILKEPCV